MVTINHTINHTKRKMEPGHRALLKSAGGIDMLSHYESMSECADDFGANGAEDPNFEWAGGKKSACVRGMNGLSDQYVSASDKLMDRIEPMLDLETSGRRVLPAMAGGAVNVPAHLSGSPLAMRMRRPDMSDRGEIHVFASFLTSASVDKALLEMRGAALLALVRAIGITRPVRLTVFCMWSNRYWLSFDVESSPLDLQRAAFALSSPTILRQMGHGLLFYHAAPYASTAPSGADQINRVARTLSDAQGVNPEHVVITPDLVSGDGLVAFQDPETAARWVQGQLTILGL